MEEPHKIGDILVAAKLLGEQDLARCFEIADKLGLPIGKVMVFSGLVDDKVIRSTVLVQSLVKEHQLDMETATKALRESARSGRRIEDTLVEFGWKAGDQQISSRIGELLVAAGAIDERDLLEVLKEAEETGLPVGRLLSLTRKVKDIVIWSALNAQVLVRDDKITRDQAIRAVKAACERQTTLEKGLHDDGIYTSLYARRLKLGELFVLSGLITEDDLMGALEISIIETSSLGKVLIQRKLISEDILATAVRIQEMVDHNTLQPLQAADVLRLVHHGMSLPKAVAEMGAIKATKHEVMRLGELLKLCGMITESDIDDVVKLASKNSKLLGKMLVFFGYLNDQALANALQCQFLIREGQIKVEQAIVAMNYTQRTGCNLDQALEELDWARPARVQER